MSITNTIYFLVIILLSLSCNNEPIENKRKDIAITNNDTLSRSVSIETNDINNRDSLFNRSSILKRLKKKKELKEPLTIHIFVPLCDNENQGIIPTSPSLGDGLNLKTNLYWATGSGTKKFFERHNKWNLIYSKLNIDTNILERVVFKRFYHDITVYIVADAYRGDRMEETVNDFFASISGKQYQEINIDSIDKIKCGSYSDLFIFNGHNGMMDDIIVDKWINTTSIEKDVVINACASYYDFGTQLKDAKGYPLVRSTILLHPGAYVLTKIIDDWVNGLPADSICLNAGRAYCKKQNCGNGDAIYISGW